LREREYITIKLAYAKYYERKFEKVHNHLDIEREREREREKLVASEAGIILVLANSFPPAWDISHSIICEAF
jgi:hypothetical protein